MAFDPQQFLLEYEKKQTEKSGFNPQEFLKKYNEKMPNLPHQTQKTNDVQQLYKIAAENNLKDQADKILGEKGEEMKKIYSGGFISDIFDTLNALQYGVVGMLKGKGFKEGVKTRQSWSDKDALGKFGIPGMIGGIALDIAVDPFTYIAPWTILKKVPGITKGVSAFKTGVFGEMITRSIATGEKLTDITEAAKKGEKIFQTIEGGTQTGKFLARKLSWMFGADPVFTETWKRSTLTKVKGSNNIVDLMNGVIDIPKEKIAHLVVKDPTGRWQLNTLDEIKKFLSPDEFKNVHKSFTNLDELGNEAVKLGRLSKETWETNRWQYLKSLYTQFEKPAVKKGVGVLKTKVSPIMARKAGLTQEAMKGLGQIENPLYLLFRSQIDLMVGNENTKLFNGIAEKFGTSTWVEGMAKKVIPDTASYGALKGKYVPEFIHDYITEIQRIKTPAEKIANQVVAGFKYGKVILNPATHARNVASNTILNWWKLGIGPWRTDLYLKALSGNNEQAKLYRELGGGLDTYAANELGNYLVSPEFGKLGVAKKALKKAAGLYQAEETFAKRAAFIGMLEKGLTPEAAFKAAESATFNYAEVTPFVRRLRESLFGFPFITFTLKATPIAAETALKTPARISIFGKIKQAIEQQSDIQTTERERASEPSWIKNGFYIKLPMKDKHGRSAYFDLTYILPFGDIMSGNFFERATKRETGLPEGIVPTIAKKSPFFQIIGELSRNQDFYGDKIWQDGDTSEKQLGDIFRHVLKTYSPPLVGDQLPGGYMQFGKDAGKRRRRGLFKAQTASEENQQRTLMEELLRNIGAKIQPVNVDVQETYMENEKRKALETLLRERGIGAEFQKFYIPKSQQ